MPSAHAEQNDLRIRRSRELMQLARRYIPGGVNSPARAFRAVGMEPVCIVRGQGCRLWDVDGNEYIDCLGSWGPLILGHGHPRVTAALQGALGRGTSFGAATELELRFAQMICEAVPTVEMVRLVNSGTEAVMSALRLARAFTGREKVVKFEGGYHGHSDGLLSKGGSGLATLGVPESPGVPASFASQTITLAYNDLEGVRALMREQPQEVACVIVEPVAGNMGVVPPQPGFLEGLRELCTQQGALLVFDEVITGFRVAYGGAQERFGISPDLTTLGKVIGGGFPIGAYGGRREIMKLVAPAGSVYQAGTLSGNPVAVTAGIETLRILKEENPYPALERAASRLAEELRKEAAEADCEVTVNQLGSLLTVFFTAGPVTDYASAASSNRQRFAAFFRAMLRQGVYLPPSQFEAMFLSTAHEQADLEAVVHASRAAFPEAAAA